MKNLFLACALFGCVVGTLLHAQTGGFPAVGPTLARNSTSFTIALTTSAGTTPEFNFNYAAGGVIFIPTGSSITTLTYHAAPAEGGTFLALQDSAGVAVVQTVAAAKAYDMPAALFGCRAVKIVANAAGSVTVSTKG